MRQGKIYIINKLGLHARAAAKLVSLATRYSSEIKLGDNNKMIDAKSIMSVMMLAAGPGTKLNLEINGSDEDTAFAAIEALINNRFDEGE